MKKSIFSVAALSVMATGAMAQETYESAQLATQNLNGTAKYMGMGGAMEALGAEISTMGSNPAGIALMRKATISASAGVTVSHSSFSGMTANKTNFDFNQVGFVYSFNSGSTSNFNIGFNYHKGHNFNMLGGAINSLNNASINKLVAMKMASVQLDDNGKKDWQSYNDSRNHYSTLDYDDRFNLNTLADYYIYGTTNNDKEISNYDSNGNWHDGYVPANGYLTGIDNSGYISNFDFNMSYNINDRVYLGLTFGLKDIRYTANTDYNESFDQGATLTGFNISDERSITGHGYDIKFGAIIRPVEESPFRVGLYFHTPTWYELTCKCSLYTRTVYNDNTDLYKSRDYSYDYKIVTPWRFGVSLGYTFGKKLALGATYEYSDYSSIKNKINTGQNTTVYYDDPWGSGAYEYTYNSYENDDEMNKNTKKVLRGVHLVKLGAEYKALDWLAIRAGYNYESALYNENGSKDYNVNAYYSNGANYSTYDYTNWKDTHRITLGAGFNLSKHWGVDFAYVLSLHNGTYHPFQSVTGLTCYDVASDGSAVYPTTESIYGTPTDVKLTRHQLNCTVSYRF